MLLQTFISDAVLPTEREQGISGGDRDALPSIEQDRLRAVVMRAQLNVPQYLPFCPSKAMKLPK
jgi:hypothetical protein